MNNKGIIPIIFALAIVLGVCFGVVVGNCRINNGSMQCVGLGGTK